MPGSPQGRRVFIVTFDDFFTSSNVLSEKRSTRRVNGSVMLPSPVKILRLFFSTSVGGVNDSSPSPINTAAVTRLSTGVMKYNSPDFNSEVCRVALELKIVHDGVLAGEILFTATELSE